MTIEVIIFGLILFSIAYGVFYIIAYLPTRWIFKTDKLKKARIIISAIGGLSIISFYLFLSPTNNNKTAIIENHGDKFLLTLTGERLLMTHDPISYLRRDTYTDTLKIIIPRAQGAINGAEIPTEKGYYKMIGTINIDGERIDVNLYYNNYDKNIKDPISWNGNYTIKIK